MPINVADVRSNLNENIRFAATVIGRSKDRRKVFEAIYSGKKKVKTVDDIVDKTGLERVRVLQEAGKLQGNQIIKQTKKDKQTAYEKEVIYIHHRKKVLAILDNPEKASKYPTKQSPRIPTNTYKIELPSKKPKCELVTIDDIDSFNRVKKIRSIDSSLHLSEVPESRIKAGLKKILGETHEFSDWGGEKNDLYTNKINYKRRRRSAAFALKGKATKGTLTPKKMGKNGDQIVRLFGASAQMFFVVYHGKIDESITSQLQAFALGKALSGSAIYYCVIDGDDLNRLFQAYRTCFPSR
jgi:hypothetical protein